jgi:hypothetical protein
MSVDVWIEEQLNSILSINFGDYGQLAENWLYRRKSRSKSFSMEPEGQAQW